MYVNKYIYSMYHMFSVHVIRSGKSDVPARFGDGSCLELASVDRYSNDFPPNYYSNRSPVVVGRRSRKALSQHLLVGPTLSARLIY